MTRRTLVYVVCQTCEQALARADTPDQAERWAAAHPHEHPVDFEYRTEDEELAT